MWTKIIERLAQYQPATLAETAATAAVMIILLEESEEFFIVLTKRTDHLPTYAGHISLPGGMKDVEDENLFATAKRETEEEIGISATTYTFLGQLDDFHDRYGNLVRPFVVTMPKGSFDKQLNVSFDEIAKLFYLPLSELEKLEDAEHLHAITRRRPSYSYTQADLYIWGLTASILVHLDNVIHGKTRSLGKLR